MRVERIFVDANTGDVVYRYDDTWTRQGADARTGTGTGVAGDRLKVPSQRVGTTYHAVDLLRPGNTTADLKADPFGDEHLERRHGPAGERRSAVR
jgi:hypothetical protein